MTEPRRQRTMPHLLRPGNPVMAAERSESNVEILNKSLLECSKTVYFATGKLYLLTMFQNCVFL